ncbi:MAG: hypothetical protein JWN70_777, partial [Planctomycetaceae bacterium]|nr:hypothetical protein [Planctomycetaceae bacterium]
MTAPEVLATSATLNFPSRKYLPALGARSCFRNLGLQEASQVGFESAANLRAQFEGAHPFEMATELLGLLEFAGLKSAGATSIPGICRVSSIRWLQRGAVELSRQRWISAGCSREAAVGSLGTGCSMLVESVNMADVARGMGPPVTRLAKGGNPPLKVKQPAPQVEKTSGAAQTGASLLGKSANMAELSRQMDAKLQQRPINEAPAKRPVEWVLQGVPLSEMTSVVAA